MNTDSQSNTATDIQSDVATELNKSTAADASVEKSPTKHSRSLSCEHCGRR